MATDDMRDECYRHDFDFCIAVERILELFNYNPRTSPTFWTQYALASMVRSRYTSFHRYLHSYIILHYNVCIEFEQLYREEKEQCYFCGTKWADHPYVIEG